MSNKRAFLFVATFVAASSGAVTAQTPDQQRCSASDPDLSIRGCTAIIQTGGETVRNLATAHFYRGLAYAAKGQLDHAIEDWNQTIQLDPSDAIAVGNRGLAYANEGQLDHAIDDYNHAIDLKQDYAEAFSNRGMAHDLQGLSDLAIEDYNQAIRLNPN